MMKYTNWEVLEKKLMKNPEFRKAVKESEPEYQLARSLIAARIKKHLSQAQVAKKAKTDQATISRIESFSAKPSLSLLRKIASALGAQLTIRFKI